MLLLLAAHALPSTVRRYLTSRVEIHKVPQRIRPNERGAPDGQTPGPTNKLIRHNWEETPSEWWDAVRLLGRAAFPVPPGVVLKTHIHRLLYKVLLTLY